MKVGDLEIDQDVDFQKGEWTFERVGWIAMALIIVFALFGLFGTGPISAATARDPDGAISVEYQRFTRHEGETTLSIQVEADQVTGETVEIWIDAMYLDGMEIQQISLEPEEVRTDGERLIYVFNADEPMAPLVITFSLQPQTLWRQSAAVGVVEGPQVTFNQFSYP